jgi:hypothetical protein
MALTLRRTWPTEGRFPKPDWEIFDDGIQVGRVYEATGSAGSRWFWAINGAAGRAASSGIRASGLASSLEAAKAAWREHYEAWLRLA